MLADENEAPGTKVNLRIGEISDNIEPLNPEAVARPQDEIFGLIKGAADAVAKSRSEEHLGR